VLPQNNACGFSDNITLLIVKAEKYQSLAWADELQQNVLLLLGRP